jgi:hypothetical protein
MRFAMSWISGVIRLLLRVASRERRVSSLHASHPSELGPRERGKAGHRLLGRRRATTPEDIEAVLERRPPLREQTGQLGCGKLRQRGEREVDRLGGRRELAPRPAQEVPEVRAPIGRDRVARSFGSAALLLGRKRVRVAVLHERSQAGVDRGVLEREPEAEEVVAQDPADAVAVERPFREEPEDEHPGEHPPSIY